MAHLFFYLPLPAVKSDLVKMKFQKISLFILSVFFLLAVIGLVMPEDGIQIAAVKFNFPSPQSVFSVKNDTVIDVEKTLEELKREADLSQIKEVEDSLLFFKEYLSNNSARFYLPENDYTFLDRFFSLLDSSHVGKRAIHITHYGDSQIEMDRISGTLRQTLQTQFGGEGAGIVPAIQTIPSYSVNQSYTGDLSRYAIYGDTTNIRASHRRYGLLASFSQLNGSATVTLQATNYKQTQSNVKQFSRVMLILGNNEADFTARCNGVTKSIDDAGKGVNTLVWDFDAPVSGTSVSMTGTAEIYGISMEGKSGVTVDNVPMRGCSGINFTTIDSTLIAQSYRAMNVRMILLQYGGNRMPQINSEESISDYMQLITRQIKRLQGTNPDAVVMFIGPSDMAKRIDGEMQTYPYLPALNDSLRKTVTANHTVYWDMFHMMGGRNSMSAWVNHSPAWASTDYIHFTDLGANEIAVALSNAFMVYYQFYRLRQTCNPGLVKEFMSGPL